MVSSLASLVGAPEAGLRLILGQMAGAFFHFGSFFHKTNVLFPLQHTSLLGSTELDSNSPKLGCSTPTSHSPGSSWRGGRSEVRCSLLRMVTPFTTSTPFSEDAVFHGSLTVLATYVALVALGNGSTTAILVFAFQLLYLFLGWCFTRLTLQCHPTVLASLSSFHFRLRVDGVRQFLFEEIGYPYCSTQTTRS